MTELDDALEIAIKNPAQANFFFDTFLNTNIFVPALRDGQRPGTWTLIAATERFFPLFLRKEEKRAVPVFDTLEKLRVFAKERDFDYLILPAHIFLKVIAADVGILLNEGTPYRYEFSTDALEKLRAAAKPLPPSARF